MLVWLFRYWHQWRWWQSRRQQRGVRQRSIDPKTRREGVGVNIVRTIWLQKQKAGNKTFHHLCVCVCVNKIFMRPFLRAFHYKLRHIWVGVGGWGNTFLMNAFIYGKILINYSFPDCLWCLRLFRKMWGKHKVVPLWPMFYYQHLSSYTQIYMWNLYRFPMRYNLRGGVWSASNSFDYPHSLIRLTSTAFQFVWLNALSILTKLKLNFHKSLLIFQFRVSFMDLISIFNRQIALCWLFFVCCLSYWKFILWHGKWAQSGGICLALWRHTCNIIFEKGQHKNCL